MKKLVLAVLLISSAHASHACDVCGSGVSNYNPFLFPHLAKSHFSLSYFNRSYTEYHSDVAAGTQQYQSLVLGGQYSLSSKTQITALVPFQFNRMTGEEGNTFSKGLGDVTVLLSYKLLDKRGTVRHNILIGGGAKLPTGKFDASKTSTDQAFQLGSGSIDYLLNGSYRATLRKWVFSAMGAYKYNTANAQGFRYGDVLSTGITAAYRMEKGSFSLAPYLQMLGEQQMQNADKKVLQSATGGNALYTGAGLDVNTRKYAIGMSYHFAAAQNLQKGSLQAKPRLSIHLSFLL